MCSWSYGWEAQFTLAASHQVHIVSKYGFKCLTVYISNLWFCAPFYNQDLTFSKGRLTFLVELQLHMLSSRLTAVPGIILQHGQQALGHG